MSASLTTLWTGLCRTAVFCRGTGGEGKGGEGGREGGREGREGGRGGEGGGEGGREGGGVNKRSILQFLNCRGSPHTSQISH